MCRLLSVSALVFLALVQSAAAQLVICNKTTAPIDLAVARETDEDLVSQGWWTVDPDKCETVIPGELDRQYYYHYARSTPLRVEWNGTFNFCIKDDPQFRATGAGDCEQRNMRTAGFRQTDVGQNKLYVLDISMGPQPAEAAEVTVGSETSGEEMGAPVSKVITGDLTTVSSGNAVKAKPENSAIISDFYSAPSAETGTPTDAAVAVDPALSPTAPEGSAPTGMPQVLTPLLPVTEAPTTDVPAPVQTAPASSTPQVLAPQVPVVEAPAAPAP